MDYTVTLSRADAWAILNLLGKLGALDVILAMPEGDEVMFEVTPREVRDCHRALVRAIETAG